MSQTEEKLMLNKIDELRQCSRETIYESLRSGMSCERPSLRQIIQDIDR